MSELNNKVALITGASQGLGAAIVEVFLREGARVVISDVLTDKGKLLAKKLGDNTRFIDHDVTSEAQWAQAIEYTKAEFGALDILVNNAGVLGTYSLDDTTPELWGKLHAIMETGPFLGIKNVIPTMLESGGGSIVNIASTNAIRGMTETAAYTAAKHGVLGLTRALALEYATKGIRINAVCPGAMQTTMLTDSLGEDLDAFAQYVPIGRFSDPREVAEVVSFLASSRASFCIGAAFVADGGMSVG